MGYPIPPFRTAVERVCGFCGHLNRDAARFCAGCGQSLDGAPSRAPLRAGQYLQARAYQVQTPLSKGGMGAVYLARDLRAFGRPCVIKEMLDYYDAGDPQARARAEARFAEEGRLLSSLSHPGIPKIYAFFEEDGRYYIVMEYILGEDLEQYVSRTDERNHKLSRKLLAEEDLLRYAVQVCAILEYLADQPRPVIHQDIKPANLIRERVVGDVRLVDFGTAGTRRGTSALPNPQLVSVYGTMGYAAPEQCSGKAEPRSDVYALAATFYHLLTDDDPREHPGSFPKLGTLRPDLQSALGQALRSDPRSRSSARQLREHLEAIVMPQRAVKTFVFPGGERISSPSGLPAMCDKHWDAARSYLYQGDFEHWLRDLNRLDLVDVAAWARKRRDQDAGLEAFLRRLDPGLARPQVLVEPPKLDVGRVAREGTLTELLCLRNTGRGYIKVSLSSPTPWLRARPDQVGLLANKPPSEVTVLVHTGDLPLRGIQRGAVVVRAGRSVRAIVPVAVQLSLPLEIWRNLGRGWRGALPAARANVRAVSGTWGQAARRASRLARRRWRWLLMACLILAGASGAGCWYWRPDLAWGHCVLIGLAAPLALAIVALVIVPLLALLVAALAGAMKGLWRTFGK